jgi:hypothetical protein
MDKFQSGSLCRVLCKGGPPTTLFFFSSFLSEISCTHFYFFFSLSAFSFFLGHHKVAVLTFSPATAIFIDVVVGDLFVFSPPSCPHSVADITHTHGQQLVAFLKRMKKKKKKK